VSLIEIEREKEARQEICWTQNELLCWRAGVRAKGEMILERGSHHLHHLQMDAALPEPGKENPLRPLCLPLRELAEMVGMPLVMESWPESRMLGQKQRILEADMLPET
jgi:hypothetical protein